MRFSEKETVLGKVKDIAITVGVVSGVGFLVCLYPKWLKSMDLGLEQQAMDIVNTGADAIRTLALAKKYDATLAVEALKSLGFKQLNK